MNDEFDYLDSKDLMQMNKVKLTEPVYRSVDIFDGKIRRIEHL